MKYSHIHKYLKVVAGQNNFVVYRCMLPSCRHFLRKEFAYGQESICWKCGNTFILTQKHRRQVKPTCCSGPSVVKDIVIKPETDTETTRLSLSEVQEKLKSLIKGD